MFEFGEFFLFVFVFRRKTIKLKNNKTNKITKHPSNKLRSITSNIAEDCFMAKLKERNFESILFLIVMESMKVVFVRKN